MKKDTLIFIAESGSKIGFGHLYRSIALAKEFLNHSYAVEFIVSNEIAEELVLNHIDNIRFRSYNSLEKNISNFKYVFLDVFKTSWVNYKDLITNNFSKTLFVSIIDFPFLDFAVKTDYIFAIGLQKYDFLEESLKDTNTKVFSGNEFFIFREEFDSIPQSEIQRKVNRVFISMGGSDPHDLTSLVLKDLNGIEEKLHLDLILGTGYSDERFFKLKELLQASNHSIIIHKNIANISTLMMNSDLAIINGGNTRFELALLGIPFISIAINEKQKEISDFSARQGIGLSLGVYNKLNKNEIASSVRNLSIDFNKRKSMSQAMKKAISGNGTKRIYKILL